MNWIIVVLLVACVINFTYMLASLIGLNLDVKDWKCGEEVTQVKRTRAFIKYFPIFNFIVFLAILIAVSLICG